MDKSILLQKQIRDNSEDLQKELREIQVWEEQMRKKEMEIRFLKADKSIPPIRTKKKKIVEPVEDVLEDEKPSKTQRIEGSDYKSWDKYDADKICSEIDKKDKANEKVEKIIEIPSEEQLNEEHEEANKYKHEGNALVQKQQYAKAVGKYSEAIKIFPYDAVYFANRALCQLKINNLHSAESDCTAAIKLDGMYVKAYHRRASARMELKRYKDAAIDLEKILQLEPSNKEATALLKQVQAKIEKSFDPMIISGNERLEKSTIEKQIGEKLLGNKSSPTTLTKSTAVEDLSENKDENKVVYKIFSDEELEKDHIEANKLKDEGNTLVQKQEYSNAIEKYCQSIKIFPYDSVYFANRALCYLKLNRFQDAERDCNFAIELDDMYVKAYIRRATARLEQKNYENALKDIKTVLKISPGCKEAAIMSNQIKMKIKDSSKANILEKASPNEENDSIKITHKHAEKQNKLLRTIKIPNQMESTVNNSLPPWLPKLKKGVNIVEALAEPNSQQKQALTRIAVNELSDNESIFKDVAEGEKKVKFERTATENTNTMHKADDVNKKDISITSSAQSCEKNIEESKNIPPPPKSSVVFLLNWRKNTSPDFRFKYLKQIQPKDLPDIFKESMESNIFSEIIFILNIKFVKNNDNIYDYLYYLAKLKRFRALVLFMTQTDKEVLKDLFSHCKMNEGRTENEVNNLYSVYEIGN